jgi:hypothetical protein
MGANTMPFGSAEHSSPVSMISSPLPNLSTAHTPWFAPPLRVSDLQYQKPSDVG